MIHAHEVFSEQYEDAEMLSSASIGPLAAARYRLSNDALIGLAGKFVKTILPHTEADPAALLINFLVGFGSMIGRNAYQVADGANHYCNLFAVLVGETSRGRKGTSWNRAKEVLGPIDPGWATLRIQSGLSSGEGLIAAVASSEESLTDPRLLVIQGEFAATLAVMGRQGNTLSALIRDAWDSVTLQTMVKNNPLRADEAHVSIIGHITREELLRELNSTQAANGFANRFLFVRSERSKCLPEGGCVPDSEIQRLAELLKPAVDFARNPVRLRRDSDATELWARVYPSLTEGDSGLLGAVTSRSEAQVLRLSGIYALLDSSEFIRVKHLIAALAFWDYAEESADWIFGNKSGDPVAESILEALRMAPDGLSRTEISALLSRNQTAYRINAALKVLADKGLVFATDQTTGGRNTKTWRTTQRHTK